ncbi:hypothetical protein POSPLADRAFT_1178960 [Postia placenta MAD-698-R-SB12]|uniref:GDP/GTP exchange factor Sec2 N-terminal domain-containing protein n=1 Tax=Postia placenta MAD-698-R-SB12 TaxID=670580 RepID=A0A1X6N9J9_9APHY|nr:hypothetical protein POSPLADRAFT_1178960 [Postia placenta MAD-698-R-SB12]OSX65281.1 hypothetical protein POSPLADRAFT_1178960 [Postia placenta MAD-698-R-SB12]
MSSATHYEQPQEQVSREPSIRPDDDQPKKSGSSPKLPDLDLPQSDLDLTMTFESILSEPQSRDDEPEIQKVQKRASNVLKLTQENEKLQAELRAMTERLEAAERKQRELSQRAARSQERPAQAS